MERVLTVYPYLSQIDGAIERDTSRDKVTIVDEYSDGTNHVVCCTVSEYLGNSEIRVVK